MERLVGYTISLSTTGQTPNETGFYDEIAVVISGEICPIIGFTYKLVEQGTIAKAEQIVPGETKLTQDITGQLCPSSGTYVIDLAGHTWRNTDIAIKVLGSANVTVIDSVGGGQIIANNDAIRPESGTLTLKDITVEADAGGCDALFIKGGNVVAKNCILKARQASVHNDNEFGATVLVDGCTLNGEDVALKGRNNAVITITGNTVFNNKNVEMQRGFDDNRSVADTFKAGANATIEFDSIVVGNGGISAWRKLFSVQIIPLCLKYARSFSQVCSSLRIPRPKIPAMFCFVRSSWVGPSPPVKMTASDLDSANSTVSFNRPGLSPTTV